VFKAHRLLYHSTLGVRVIIKNKKRYQPHLDGRVEQGECEELPVRAEADGEDIILHGDSLGHAQRELCRAALALLRPVLPKLHL